MTLFSNSDYIASKERVISEWSVGKDLVGSGSGLILRYHPDICLKELRKTNKNPSRYSRSPGRDLKPGHLEYEAGVLTTRPQLLFKISAGWEGFKETRCFCVADAGYPVSINISEPFEQLSSMAHSIKYLIV
jgi:hypothetical protein